MAQFTVRRVSFDGSLSKILGSYDRFETNFLDGKIVFGIFTKSFSPGIYQVDLIGDDGSEVGRLRVHCDERWSKLNWTMQINP